MLLTLKLACYNFTMLTKVPFLTKKSINIQEELCPELPLILGCKDYSDEEKLLKHADNILKKSGVESQFVQLSMARYEEKAASEGKVLLGWQRAKHAAQSQQALRCNVLQLMLGESFREMSKRLAQCPLFQWFCKIGELDRVRVPGKSTLQRYKHWIEEKELKQIGKSLIKAVSDEKMAEEIGIKQVLLMEQTYMDTTCLEADIHYPADWLLMRDATRGVIASITTIRKHGLIHRMPSPSSFTRKMNGLCIGMTAAFRESGSNRQRKKIVRQMKTLSKTVRNHGKRYRDLLDKEWNKTDLSRNQAETIIKHIDNIITQLPEAMRQAHERIIGGRQVPASEKIFSLNDSDIHNIHRGKAGSKTEFGNCLLIVEQQDGLIIYHELVKETSPGDAQLLINSLPELQAVTNNELSALGADRQFSTKATKALLKSENIFDGLCPKDPEELSKRLKEETGFSSMLTRRAQTEGRVGIIKNVFLGGTPKAKGYKNRSVQVAWAILAHNLWVVARKAKWKDGESSPLAA